MPKHAKTICLVNLNKILMQSVKNPVIGRKEDAKLIWPQCNLVSFPLTLSVKWLLAVNISDRSRNIVNAHSVRRKWTSWGQQNNKHCLSVALHRWQSNNKKKKLPSSDLAGKIITWQCQGLLSWKKMGKFISNDSFLILGQNCMRVVAFRLFTPGDHIIFYGWVWEGYNMSATSWSSFFVCLQGQQILLFKKKFTSILGTAKSRLQKHCRFQHTTGKGEPLLALAL